MPDTCYVVTHLDNGSISTLLVFRKFTEASTLATELAAIYQVEHLIDTADCERWSNLSHDISIRTTTVQ